MKNTKIDLTKYTGCFLGLATGDAFGARFEGGPLEQFLWKCIGKTRDGRLRYTDDTQMSIDVAESFLVNNAINQDHLANTFANSYRWSRGYGPGAGWLLKKIKQGKNWRQVNRAKFKQGSFGNGAAMRAPIIALCFPEDRDQLIDHIILCSEITHAHPLAIEGASLVALVTQAALQDRDLPTIVNLLTKWTGSDVFNRKLTHCIELLARPDQPVNREIKTKLGNGIAATESCVTAIYFALYYRNLERDLMFKQIFSLGGDADTIGAMAGAIWGSFNGVQKMNRQKDQIIEDYEHIVGLSEKLFNLHVVA